jgi:succinate dehydrogenase / fumarate reductase cytochrome b subunit
MSETATATSAQSGSLSRSYFWNKAFSLLGVLPLSVYTLIHLYGKLTALNGPDAFNAHLAETRTGAFTGTILILLIWVPILIHGIIGLQKIKQAKPNNLQFKHWENLKYITQRVSGVGIFLFLPAHIFKSKVLPTYINGVPADFAHMSEAFHEPLTLTVYLLGILGVAYHLGNGFWQFCIGWGITITQKAMNRAQVLSILLFLITLSMGYGAIYGLLTRGSL